MPPGIPKDSNVIINAAEDPERKPTMSLEALQVHKHLCANPEMPPPRWGVLPCDAIQFPVNSNSGS